jgi:hypothetical protein
MLENVSEVFVAPRTLTCFKIVRETLFRVFMAKTLVHVHRERSPAPGPSDYKVPSTVGDAPKWTINSRHELKDREALSEYRALPSTVGDGPKLSIGNRFPEHVSASPGPSYVPPGLGEGVHKPSIASRNQEVTDPRASNPGPGSYEISPRFSNEAHKYTLKGRQNVEYSNPSPGPAAYSPDFKKAKVSAPAPSIHIRPAEKTDTSSPGPSDYSINRDLPGHNISMHVRPDVRSIDNNPGPGQYSPTGNNEQLSPHFTIKGRHDIPQKVVDAPYRSLPDSFASIPKISLSSRHRELQGNISPGPSYVPPGLGSDAQKTSMSFRTQSVTDPRASNPGPGSYEISPRFSNDAHKYTLKGRQGVEYSNPSPGPAAYSPDFNKSKVSAPAPSIHIRPADRSPDQRPGYIALPSTLTGPKYTIGVRDPMDVIPR